MATMIQVHCTKKDGPDYDRRIDGIGGPGWFRTTDKAITEIEGGQSTFYTNVNGNVAIVQVKKHPTSGRKFLTTSPDGIQPNNLLYLPDCPR